MIRRFGTPPEAGRVYKHRPGAYVVLLRGDDMLVTRQEASKTLPEPEYQLPGGGIDPGESVLSALHREVMEETGWRVTRPRRLGAYRRFTYMVEYDLWAEKVAHLYVASPIWPLSPPTEDGHTVQWMPAGLAVEALESDADRAMLIRYLNGEFGPF